MFYSLQCCNPTLESVKLGNPNRRTIDHGGVGGRASSDEFGRAVSQIAVAQICESAGFNGVKNSAIEALSDVTIRYLIDLGKIAEFYANLAGRSQCSVFDLILGLEDLEQVKGFIGSGQSQCLLGSGTVRDLMRFVNCGDEVPFAQPIPNFPVIRQRKVIPSFLQMGEAPPSKHIPPWLPALPDPHTYIHTPMWDERTCDPREDKVEQARQRRKAERSLLSLQKRLLLCSGSVETRNTTSNVVVPSGGGASLRQGEGEGGDKNPYLKAPVDNKDVSPVPLPGKLSDDVDMIANHVSVLEAFAPAIEMMRSSGVLCEDDGMQGRTVLPAVRPTVYFKFRAGKKLIHESLDMRNQKKDASRTAALAGREDERDDKKRRVELILKQSMENPQELTLL
ncbi:transcription initiation factor TFIID subunit 8-like isoform X2 [Arachis ipaensis]|uniref:transcription initiation factor TFIID subunit 8-like isoform X2 n=1 Tax=Arachis ipaensis TaxID=130454 RepID=UPI000A2B8AC2|nr:transcription initiation factor TFIID subunit 8-like isoform X2 [Arachis ipaensis]